MASKVSYLYRNYPGTYRHGYVVLPSSFILDHGDEVPKHVFMHIPNGDRLRGCYSKKRTCISGLQDMMEFYCVKPFYLMLIHYLGGRDFELEIFSPYAVEISYPCREVGHDFEKNYIESGKKLKPVYDYVEVDKNNANLYFNALNISQDGHEFMVQKIHLGNSEEYNVLGAIGCAQLGLDLSVNMIELSFRNYKWKVNLKWKVGIALFDSTWEKFVKEANLCEGDTCVIERTDHDQICRVALFEAKNLANFNTAGLQQGKSLMKFFKIVNHTMAETGVLEFPKLFVNRYENEVKEDVNLFVADGKRFTGTYFSDKHLLQNLKDLVQNYKITEKNFIFFDYVGNSCFYLTMFSPWGFDICNQIKKKLQLKDLIAQTGEALNEANNEDILMYNADVLGVPKYDNSPIFEVDDKCGYSTEVIGEVEHGGQVNSFTNIIRSSHTDQRGHGMYIGKNMINVYRSWRKYTILCLIYQGREWKVAAMKNKHKCRFGKGWNKFTADNIFSIGRKLTFIYRAEKSFEVIYV